MIPRTLATVAVVAVSLSANPARRPSFYAPARVLPADPPSSAAPAPTDLAALLAADPVAALDACARKYRAEVRGFRATLHKQERVAGTLHPPEEIRVAVREQPYSVSMIWDKGARPVKIGGLALAKVEGVLYAAGENDGNMIAWRPAALFGSTNTTNPTGDQARSASRYSITEAGMGQAIERTRKAWAESRDAGKLKVKYGGPAPVPELGGRVCHRLARTCDPAEVDPFLSTEPRPDAALTPADAFRTVTVLIDAETWCQVGTVIERADGELVGAYYFRDVELNPRFEPDRFKPTAFRR